MQECVSRGYLMPSPRLDRRRARIQGAETFVNSRTPSLNQAVRRTRIGRTSQPCPATSSTTSQSLPPLDQFLTLLLSASSLLLLSLELSDTKVYEPTILVTAH